MWFNMWFTIRFSFYMYETSYNMWSIARLSHGPTMFAISYRYETAVAFKFVIILCSMTSVSTFSLHSPAPPFLFQRSNYI